MKYNQAFVKCKNCGHMQLHKFKFGNYSIPRYHHDQEYDFNFICSKCHKKSTAVFNSGIYEIDMFRD